MNNQIYSFCETVTATGSSPWHIRKLSDNGPKYGGEADTPALCGRTVAWDVDCEMKEHVSSKGIYCFLESFLRSAQEQAFAEMMTKRS